MRTHKEALYARFPGDKFRPVVIRRPTLRQLAAKLRVTERRIRNANKLAKAGQPVSPYLARLERHRNGLLAYIGTIGLNFQPPVERSIGYRIGKRVNQLLRKLNPLAA